jgi:hypothetical protein
MSHTFQILPSVKVGLNSKESYIVVRDQTSFLRILGADPQWEIMTATASEDHGRIQVCNDRIRLVQAAWRLGTEIDTLPKVQSDWMGREYVIICVITQDCGQNDKEFEKESNKFFTRFFELYDNYQVIPPKGNREMRYLYDTLATDDRGGDVYLSDGVWLSNDGSLHDRSR